MRRSARRAVASMGIVAMATLGVALPAAAADSPGDPTPASTETPTPPPAGDSLELEPVVTPSPPQAKTAAKPSTKASPAPAVAKERASGDRDASGNSEPAPEAEAEAHAHDDAALVEASEALTAAEADLERAKLALKTAREEVVAAREADSRAQAELEVAVLAQERAVREIAENRRRLQKHRSELGQLARAAYQSNGPLGELALVLESETPKQMTDRVAFVHSIATAGNAVVSDLEEARADLRNSRARLAAARELQEERRAAAADALAAVEAKETVAEVAQQQVDMVVTLRKLALAAALEAKKLDQRRYQVMRVQSGRLGARIAELGGELDAGRRPPKGSGKFVRPGTGALTSPYGPRLHPILRYVKIHTGLDLGVGDGFAYAADAGVVIITEPNVAYGNMTVIYHGKVGGLRTATLYAHQAAFGVQPGDRVSKGQAIGVIGSTGYSTGPHLHFEVLLEGRQVDPDPFLDGAPLPDGARANASGARAAR